MNHDPPTMTRQVADEHGAAAVPLDTMQLTAMRAKAGNGRCLRFSVVIVLKSLSVEFSEAWEVLDARHL